MMLGLSLPLAIVSFATLTSARFYGSCENIAVTSLGVLSATCDDGNGGKKDASLDLKHCFTYVGQDNVGLITIGDGYLPKLCRECSIVYKPDPVWPTDKAWLRCYCQGAWWEHDTKDFVDNDFGVLTCDRSRQPICE